MKLELWGTYLKLEVKVETFRPQNESSIQRKGERWIRFIGKKDAGVGRTLRGSNNVSAVDDKRLDNSSPYSQSESDILKCFYGCRSGLWSRNTREFRSAVLIQYIRGKIREKNQLGEERSLDESEQSKSINSRITSIESHLQPAGNNI